MFTCCSSPPDMCPWLTGCLNVSWSSSRTSAWMITSSWLHLHLVGPRLYTRVSRATSTWCVWLGTASASRRHGFEMPWMVTTSSPMVAPISRGVTFVESSFGVFTSKACAVAVSIGKFSGKPFVLKSSSFFLWYMLCKALQNMEFCPDLMTKLCNRLHRADTTGNISLSAGSSEELPEGFYKNSSRLWLSVAVSLSHN